MTNTVGSADSNVNGSPTLGRALLIGGLGFMVASLVVFATVAFAERWMYDTFGLIGAYLVWTILFIALGGGVIGSLVKGRWRLPLFYVLFFLAFLAYATGWCLAYFFVRGTKGEWIGSLVGSVAMGLLLTIPLGAARSPVVLSLMLFVANSLGYFVGSAVNDSVGGRPGMLLWGAVYGLCLGAGLGAVVHLAQARKGSA